MKNLFKGLIGKKVNVEVTSMKDLVEKLKWAEVEVSDTKDALTGLQYRLHNGVLVMEDIAKDAEDVINYHKLILDKANSRRKEFTGHISQVDKALGLVDAIYTESK